MTPDAELEALLDGIWVRRRVELLERIRQMSVHLDRAAGADLDAWAQIGAEAHRLTGALGSLGFDALAHRARELERAVSAQPSGPGDPQGVRHVIDGMHDALRAAAARPSACS